MPQRSIRTTWATSLLSQRIRFRSTTKGSELSQALRVANLEGTMTAEEVEMAPKRKPDQRLPSLRGRTAEEATDVVEEEAVLDSLDLRLERRKRKSVVEVLLEEIEEAAVAVLPEKVEMRDLTLPLRAEIEIEDLGTTIGIEEAALDLETSRLENVRRDSQSLTAIDLERLRVAVTEEAEVEAMPIAVKREAAEAELLPRLSSEDLN